MELTRRARAATALGLCLALGAGCIKTVNGVPTAGYGDPYKGTGEAIYVKDSRGDWDISEGKHELTSEQALEATGDPEYEARRQIAKAHNDELYREGLAHKQRGNLMMKVGLGATIAGIVLGLFVPSALQTTSTTPASAELPEMRETRAGGASKLASALCTILVIGGAGTIAYGYWGGKRPPPYHIWATPPPLHRPAYVRQQTEPYNEKLGLPTMPDDEDGGTVVKARPGAKPARPGMPPMRGRK